MRFSSQVSRLAYRPEIDGLRAVAIGLVLLYHLDGEPILPNGFIGVDIFFVISGYVVFRSAFERLSTMTAFEFISDFARRRFARIAPALVIYVVAASFLVSFFAPNPNSYIKTASSALLGVSNISLYRGSWNYFSEDSALNPFTQTWSLGVEAQFYFLLPLILVLFFRLIRCSRQDLALSFFLLSGTVISLAAFLSIGASDRMAAYYLPQYRFWEFGAGILAYLLPKRCFSTLPAFGSSKIALCIAPCYLIGISTLSLAGFLDWRLVIVVTVLLTSLFLSLPFEAMLARSVLSSPFMIHVGHISYSLYLWHWGVLVLLRRTIGISGLTGSIYAIILPYIISLLSYVFVEKKSLVFISSLRPSWLQLPSLVGVTLGFAFLLAKLSSGAFFESIYLGQKTDSYMKLDKSVGNLSYSGKLIWHNYRAVSQPGGRFLQFLGNYYGVASREGSGSRRIFFIGDSHTEHYYPLIKRVSEVMGLDVAYAYEHGARYPTVHWEREGRMIKDVSQGLNTRLDRAFSLVADHLNRGDVVVFSSRMYEVFSGHPDESAYHYFDKTGREISADVASKVWLEKLVTAAEVLHNRGVMVVVMGGIPFFGDSNNAPRLEEECSPQWFNGGAFKPFKDCPQFLAPVERNLLLKKIAPYRDRMIELSERQDGFFFFDPFPSLCPPASAQCRPVVKGIVAYSEDDHLSARGALIVADSFIPFLRNLLEKKTF